MLGEIVVPAIPMGVIDNILYKAENIRIHLHSFFSHCTSKSLSWLVCSSMFKGLPSCRLYFVHFAMKLARLIDYLTFIRPFIVARGIFKV